MIKSIMKKNKDRIMKNKLEYYYKNKYKMDKYHKQYNKDLYTRAINRICNYYNKPPVCFFCGKKQSIKNGRTTIYIDHKSEKVSKNKDELTNNKLYRYISYECKEDELNNYQLLCMKCNLMKEHIYKMIIQLKNKGDIKKYNNLLNIYNNTLITNVNKKENDKNESK